MVLQFRHGKLVGRMHWSGDLSDILESDEILASVLLQHYQKNPAPEQVLVPPSSLSLSTHELSEALTRLQREGSTRVEVRKADEREDWWAAFELAKENVKAWNEEQRSQRLKQHDSLLKLQKLLNLPRLPRWMECIDISNFQGAANVASCVVFVNGKPSKENYRHYKIQSFEGQNDFASMKELVSRRYGKQNAKLPDLLVVDGGKGQLASVLQILEALKLDFPIISLAKARTQSDFESEDLESSEERIFVPNQKNHKKIRDAGVLKLLTQIRDEAHRFAIEFHRKKLRDSMFQFSSEDDGN
jgi:excinuclease ABC subunit C